MLTGSEEVYVPVQANSVNALAETGDSSWTGTEIEGTYVNWDLETGITGKGWKDALNMTNNPFSAYGLNDEEDIKTEIKNKGSLNDVFDYWKKHYTDGEISQFITAAENKYGFYNPEHVLHNPDGCIGEQIY